MRWPFRKIRPSSGTFEPAPLPDAEQGFIVELVYRLNQAVPVRVPTADITVCQPGKGEKQRLAALGVDQVFLTFSPGHVEVVCSLAREAAGEDDAGRAVRLVRDAMKHQAFFGLAAKGDVVRAVTAWHGPQGYAWSAEIPT